MSLATGLAAVLGLSHAHKSHGPLDPFKRTLELERMREVKAAADLQEALRGLVRAVEERRDGY